MTPEERIAKHNLRPYLDIVEPSWGDLNQFDYLNAINSAERVRAAIHAEREACAKVAEADTSFDMLQDFGMQSHSAQLRTNIAESIRNRMDHK